ncbi:HpcH/HpaI aldolase/citrate lyase family protein [Paenibacillus sp. V4I5]|uniref:HpcH/HpaI aldolase family protein n=1 Tax=Paenibacillus sp. V4I5 TaxID=3042306 RepID=UPI00278D747C|nr:aldolase/citrate lyase family protein [Paenibacillus sp. V4I5]MDQ0916519.1 2-keto-3-deoxy-L-rhamnonate aldolase RhmA [Paenibacillus sp. V4I5]
MLRTNRLKQKLREGKEVFGLFCSIPSPVVVEMIGLAGYDFVIIDTEHVLINPETIEHMIRAAEAVDLTALVRVPEADAGAILRALDGGAYGIVVPHIESIEQAEFIVKASRYFPQGERSLNGGRPGAFGKNSLLAYMSRANDEIMVIPMIESKQGVERIEEIVSVEGIDMIMVGTADLSQSYGVPWQTQHEVVRKAVRTVCSSAVKKDIPFCAIPRKLDEMDEWRESDVKAYVLGDERGIAFRALQDHLNKYVKEMKIKII